VRMVWDLCYGGTKVSSVTNIFTCIHSYSNENIGLMRATNGMLCQLLNDDASINCVGSMSVFYKSNTVYCVPCLTAYQIET